MKVSDLAAAILGAIAASSCALKFDTKPVEPPPDTSTDPDATDTEATGDPDGVEEDVKPDEPWDEVDELDVQDVLDVEEEDPAPEMDAVDIVDLDTPVEDPGEEEPGCLYSPLVCVTDDLRTMIEAIDIASAVFVAPTSSRRTNWGTLLGYVLAANWANTLARAGSMGVEVTAVHDSVTRTDYILIHDPTNGEGTYVINLSPTRDYVFEVPYPVDDAGTLAQGIEALRGTTGGESGWALLIGGTDRCESTISIPCDGTTVACTGSTASFRLSDVAHNPNLVFHTVHVQLLNTTPAPAGGTPIAIQFQDQSDASGAYAYASDGTTTDGTGVPLGISILLRNALRTEFPAWSSSILSCNDPIDRALTLFDSDCQTTNVQGRWTNNPSGSPCSVPATTSSDRFVVLEEGVEMRDTSQLTTFVVAIYLLP